MKRVLLASLLCGFACTVSAQSVTISAGTDTSPNLAQSHDRDEDEQWFADRHCMRQTGSRIVARHNAKSDRSEQRCVTANGRVYTRGDIERTGVIDMAEALRRLDPSIH